MGGTPACCPSWHTERHLVSAHLSASSGAADVRCRPEGFTDPQRGLAHVRCAAAGGVLDRSSLGLQAAPSRSSAHLIIKFERIPQRKPLLRRDDCPLAALRPVHGALPHCTTCGAVMVRWNTALLLALLCFEVGAQKLLDRAPARHGAFQTHEKPLQACWAVLLDSHG